MQGFLRPCVVCARPIGIPIHILEALRFLKLHKGHAFAGGVHEQITTNHRRVSVPYNSCEDEGQQRRQWCYRDLTGWRMRMNSASSFERADARWASAEKRNQAQAGFDSDQRL